MFVLTHSFTAIYAMKLNLFKPVEGAPEGFSQQPAVITAPVEKLLWKLLILTAFTYVIWNERIIIHIGAAPVSSDTILDQAMAGKRHFLGLWDMLGGETPATSPVFMDTLTRWAMAVDPGFGARNGVERQLADEYQQDCRKFIQKFAPIAIAEMRRFKVPASILIAQALMESDAGLAGFVEHSHNYFPRTCRNSECHADHLEQGLGEMEPIHVFPNVWESFRAQCRYLSGNPALKKLIKKGETDFQVWSQKLAQQGYSKDLQYAAKLNALIQAFELTSLDTRGRQH